MRLVAGTLCLAVAALLAVTALDLRRVDDRLRAGDARYAAGGAATTAWPDEPRPLVHVPDALLGHEDDLALRRALQLARASQGLDDPNADAVTLARLHSQAEAALLRYLERDAPAERHALAANVLGIMLYEDSLVSRSSSAAFLDRSVRAFRRAILLDPAAAGPKRNLELVLALVRRQPQRQREGRGGTGSNARRSGSVYAGTGY